jgi:hypothetical protein
MNVHDFEKRYSKMKRTSGKPMYVACYPKSSTNKSTITLFKITREMGEDAPSAHIHLIYYTLSTVTVLYYIVNHSRMVLIIRRAK